MTTYAAQWPIHDDATKRSELIALAEPELSEMVERAGHWITGPVRWEVDERGDTLWLNAHAPVAPVVDDEPEPQPESQGDYIAGEIEHLLASDPGLLPQNAADRFGMTWEGVRQVLKRAGRLDLARRITENHERRNWHLYGRRSA